MHLDGCIEVEAAYYGAPPGWIGRAVHVQWDERHVRLVDPKTGTLLRELQRKPRGWREVHPDDRPARTPASTEQLLLRARNAGKSIGIVCAQIHHRSAEAGVRRVLGVLSLVKKHGGAAVETACAAALEVGYPDYRFVRKWLERHPAAPLSLRQVDPLIRELAQYREHVIRLSSTQISP